MIGLFVQCRLDSSRLPAKALFDLGGAPLLERVLQNLSPIQVDHRVLLCDDFSFDIFLPIAKRNNWAILAGSKEDVLDRFIKGLDGYPVDYIIRATADNPLVCTSMVERCVTHGVMLGADHVRMDGLAHGGGVEVVRSEPLRHLASRTKDPFEREHVCPGIWRYPDRFRCEVLQAPGGLRAPEVSITVDTMDDYQRLSRYYAQTSSPGYEDYLSRETLDGRM